VPPGGFDVQRVDGHAVVEKGRIAGGQLIRNRQNRLREQVRTRADHPNDEIARRVVTRQHAAQLIVVRHGLALEGQYDKPARQFVGRRQRRCEPCREPVVAQRRHPDFLDGGLMFF